MNDLQQRLARRDALLKALEEATESADRRDAYLALGESDIADVAVLSALREGLSADRADEVLAAAQALYALQGSVAYSWIVEATATQSLDTARELAHWLIRQDQRGARELARLLDREDSRLFGVVATALRTMPDLLLDWYAKRLPQRDIIRGRRALGGLRRLIEEGWEKEDKDTRKQRRNEALLLLLSQQNHPNEVLQKEILEAIHELQGTHPADSIAFRLPMLKKEELPAALDLLRKKGEARHANAVRCLLSQRELSLFTQAMETACALDPIERLVWFEQAKLHGEDFLVPAIKQTIASQDAAVWEDLFWVVGGAYTPSTRLVALEGLLSQLQKAPSQARKAKVRELLHKLIEEEKANPGMSDAALEKLAAFAEEADKAIFLKATRSDRVKPLTVGLRVLREHWLEEAREAALRLYRSTSDDVQREAFLVFAAEPLAVPRSLVLQGCRHEDCAIRDAFLEALRDLSQDAFAPMMGDLLTAHESVIALVMERWTDLDEAGQLALVEKALPRSSDSAVSALVEMILAKHPQPWSYLEAVFPKLRARQRMFFLRAFERESSLVYREDAQAHRSQALILAREACQDRDGDVRYTALMALLKLCPKTALNAAFALREDKEAVVRDAVVAICAAQPCDASLAILLPMARDEESGVRRKALEALFPYDDPEVFSEIVSSLNDVNEEIRNMVTKKLGKKAEDIPSAKMARRAWMWGFPSFGDPAEDEEPFWKQIQREVDEVRLWASRTGQMLLGVPVIVHQYRQGLGRTWRRSREGVVEIELTDTPITQGHLYGEEIVKGLALHEIGHHLYDIGVRGYSTVRGIARSEGLKTLFDVLIDERLERRLRSRRPQWGIYFDRLASYAFAQRWHRLPLKELASYLERDIDAVRDDIERGLLPGILIDANELLTEGRLFGRLSPNLLRMRRLQEDRLLGEESVLLRDSDMLRIPDALSPYNAFLWCLRCGFDPAVSVDPRIAEAMALVQGDFRHLDHAGILRLARQLAAILGDEDADRCCQNRQAQKLSSLSHLRTIMQRLKGRMRESGLDAAHGDCLAPGNVRKQEREIIYERKPRGGEKGAGGQTLHLGAQIDFPQLDREETLSASPKEAVALQQKIRPHIRTLRAYFERLGRSVVDEYASRRGRRVDMGQIRSACFRPSLNLLVNTKEVQRADLYIGLLIDRSGSMYGQKLETAKAFGTLLCESAKGLRGITGHVHAFDDNTLYPLGSFERNTIASLTSGGANNDAGALFKAAQMALQSGKRRKLLVMISDGSPTECSVESLKELVQVLQDEYGILCAQAAVESLSDVAFPHYVDLSQYAFSKSVQQFGNLLISLTENIV